MKPNTIGKNLLKNKDIGGHLLLLSWFEITIGQIMNIIIGCQNRTLQMVF